MWRTLMWLHLFGREAVQHKIKNGLKTIKMHFFASAIFFFALSLFKSFITYVIPRMWRNFDDYLISSKKLGVCNNMTNTVPIKELIRSNNKTENRQILFSWILKCCKECFFAEIKSNNGVFFNILIKIKNSISEKTEQRKFR